ncbi:MAG: flagellar FlbD family protein [Oscillospiraceae bacterium]|nr:flagellar FlbD family protein [Oscillospiraceae bacterium]
MIVLTKLTGEEFTLNCNLIETIYEKPDTTINLTNGRYYIVKEPMAEVVQRAKEYQQSIYKNILNTQY